MFIMFLNVYEMDSSTSENNYLLRKGAKFSVFIILVLFFVAYCSLISKLVLYLLKLGMGNDSIDTEGKKEKGGVSSNVNVSETASASTPHRENKNIWLALVYTFFFYFSRSLWSANIFTLYIYILEDSSNLKVGYITGFAGVIQVLVAPFAGYLADKSRRDKMLRVSGK